MRPGAPGEPTGSELSAAAERVRTEPFMERLVSLYGKMDAGYEEVAARYGFQCRGCEESCCRTTFYHHTLVEVLWLRQGLMGLEAGIRSEILDRARRVDAAPGTGRFCPLIEDERCRLYEHRPMICRLHGLAHEFCRPDGSVLKGPGCAAFDRATEKIPYIRFDRSPFYWELSALERDARQAAGFSGRIKMTVSRIVTTVLACEEVRS